MLLLVQHGDQLQLLFGCNPNVVDSAKGSDLPGRFLFAEMSTEVPTILMSSTFPEKSSCDSRWTQRQS